MIRNYFHTGWRNLLKNKAFAFINIGGLAVGIAVATLIGLWIYDELTFDRNFHNYDRIAQVIQNVTNNGETDTWTNVPFPLGEELRKNYGSDIRRVTMATSVYSHILSFEEKKLSKPGAYFEPEAMDMLSLELTRGSHDALNDPSSILLSESTAAAYFGDEDPIGKIMKLDNSNDVKVTGVYKDMPYNSSFARLHFVAPWELLVTSSGMRTRSNPWRCNCYVSYVEITEKATMEEVSMKIKDIKMKNVHEEELIHHPQLFLHPMNRWHLYSTFRNGVNTGGRIQYVKLFAVIGIFVLVLACINFMNLSTARSENRAKEVGIRKAIGSARSQLIFQFFIESVLVVAMAFVLSILLVQLSLPFFNEVSDKRMHILWNQPYYWLLGIGFSFITALIAGSYPSLFLSSFLPVKALKGGFRTGRSASLPRQVMVVLQFTISVILIIGTIVVFEQIQFARNRPIGYSREGLVAMPMGTRDIHKHFDAVKDELIKSGLISEMAESSSPVTEVWGTNSGFDWKGKDPNLAVDFPNTEVSYDYGKTVGWEFVLGRDFSREFVSDTAGFILNETAAKFMRLEDPIGEVVTWDGVPYHVIGVIKDVIMESPYSPVRPSVFHLSNDAGNVVIARINPEASAGEALSRLEQVFKVHNPSQPFVYEFTDEEYAKKFGNEVRVGRLAGFFSALAIFISCLGLFGMASFVAEQRTKEVGIRKVMGASVSSLWQMLSRDFIILVVISCAIAIPLASYFMNSWLQQYQYRTTLSWYVFVFAAGAALTITLVTVSYQAIRAAMMSPVNSLRTE